MSSVLYDAPGPKALQRSRLISWVVGALVIGGLGYSVFQLSNQGLFAAERWDIFNDPLVWLDLLNALVTGTLAAAGLAAIGAIALGIVFSLLRSSRVPWIRIPTTVVLEFFRGMPVLLLILFILLVFGVPAFWSVVIALTLYNGTIIGEALRAGLRALPKGQGEAGLAVGLRPLQSRLLIEFPQAFRNMLPIIVAQLVVLLKDTSLGYIVGMTELVRRGRLTSEFFGAGQYAFSVYFVVVAMYLIVNLSLSFLARWLAKRRGQKLDTGRLKEGGFGDQSAVGAAPFLGAGGGSAGGDGNGTS